MVKQRKERWYHQLIDTTNPTRDAKILAFISVVAAAIAWLSCEQIRGPITGQWVDVFYGLCALVGLGGSAWALVDKLKVQRGDSSGEKAKVPEEQK